VRSLALAGLAALLVTSTARADEPKAQTTASGNASTSDDQRSRSEGLIAKQFAQIRAEYDAVQAAHRQAAVKAESTRDKRDGAASTFADAVPFCRRMVDLAESCPDHVGARDALIWVFNTPRGSGDLGAYRVQLARAGALLVRYHGDDPEAVRIGLMLSNVLHVRHDAVLFGFYVAAKGHDSKGIARMALAQYLDGKAKVVAYARSIDGRPKRRFMSGGKVVREWDVADDDYADYLALRQCDPQVIRDEAVRLYEEVISDYGDIPYVTWRYRELEALLKEPAPQWLGKPMTDERRHKIAASLASKRTLGQEAADRLDVMLNLAVGRPAPEIEGADMDGMPLRLSDYKGKVVVLVFWGSWCGPCMAMVPQERELVERLKGQPFAMLGVDCEENKDTARGVMARERMTWPNWYDGAPGVGPIAGRYHVRGYPSVFVLDASGVIRARGRADLDRAVDKLLEEMKQPASSSGSSPPGSEKDEPPRP
jgi:thiol-disulfide isomerase/thioredoxin